MVTEKVEKGFKQSKTTKYVQLLIIPRLTKGVPSRFPSFNIPTISTSNCNYPT